MLLIRLLDAMNRVSTGGKMILYHPFYKLVKTANAIHICFVSRLLDAINRVSTFIINRLYQI